MSGGHTSKLVAVFALVVGLFGSTAFAHETAWSMNAGGCVPTDLDVALQGTHYWTVTGGMRVKFKSTDTNDINLVCPITALNPSVSAPDYIIIYHGNTSAGTNCPVGATTCKHYVVYASLRSVDLTNGAYSTLCTLSSNVGQLVLSNNFGPWARSYCSIGALNTSRYSYWVEVTIHRDDANGYPELNAVELANDVYSAGTTSGNADVGLTGGRAY